MTTQAISALPVRPSLIKPQLRSLSGSGKQMSGVIIERDLEFPLSSADLKPGAGTRHVLLCPAHSAARLEWTSSGRRKQSLYAPSDLILNPAGYLAAPKWNVPIELLLIAIEPQHLTKMAEAVGARPGLEVEMKFQFEDQLLTQLLRTLVQEFESDVPADPLYAETLSQALLLHLIRTLTAAKLPERRAKTVVVEPRVQRAVEYIHAHLSHKLSLEQISREAGLNSSQFSYVFKSVTGLPPHQYVLRQRVERAIDLLKDTKLSVSEIAVQTGFADQSHLTRLMRQQRGVTPAQVRRSS